MAINFDTTAAMESGFRMGTSLIERKRQQRLDAERQAREAELDAQRRQQFELQRPLIEAQVRNGLAHFENDRMAGLQMSELTQEAPEAMKNLRRRWNETTKIPDYRERTDARRGIYGEASAYAFLNPYGKEIGIWKDVVGRDEIEARSLDAMKARADMSSETNALKLQIAQMSNELAQLKADNAAKAAEARQSEVARHNVVTEATSQQRADQQRAETYLGYAQKARQDAAENPEMADYYKSIEDANIQQAQRVAQGAAKKPPEPSPLDRLLGISAPASAVSGTGAAIVPSSTVAPSAAAPLTEEEKRANLQRANDAVINKIRF